MSELSKVEIQEIANKAAINAVDLAFLHLGVDINDPRSINAIREDFEFLKRTNRGAREIKNAAIKTCVGAVITGFIAMIVLGFKDTVLSWFK